MNHIEFTFNQNKQFIFCESVKTRNGFKHVAYLRLPIINNNFVNGIEFLEIDSVKINYLNRTWESFQFESVIKKLITKHFKKDFDSVIKLIIKE
jgi:hypothetical protein